MGHWYKQDGSPCHEIMKADGSGLRDTTLRDARKHNLFYSVSTINSIPKNDFLDSWQVGQLLNAVNEHKTLIGKENWEAIVLEKSKKVQKDSQKRGTAIHNALEQYFLEGTFIEEEKEFIMPVIGLLEMVLDLDGVESEVSFAHKDGFGGTIDLINHKAKWILDFKTKAKEKVGADCAYDENRRQLAAYRVGAGNSEYKCYNCYISTAKAGEVYLHEWEEYEIQQAKEMFYHLLRFKQIQDNYIPRMVEATNDLPWDETR